MFGVPAEHFADIANVIGLAVVGALIGLGQWRGRKEPPAHQDMQIAGALVDSRAVEELTAAMRAQTEAIKAETRSREELVHAIGRMTNQTHELRDEIARRRDR